MKRKSHKSMRLKMRLKARRDGEVIVDTTRSNKFRLNSGV